MSRVYFISDLHLSHRTILAHCPQRGGRTVMAHDMWVIEQMLSVKPDEKRTLWWILGDVSMEVEALELLNKVPGRKRLVLGNHDLFDTQVYLKYFESVHGMVKKYGMWLTHAPMHPDELRGKPNLHGHCHAEQIRDPRYYNVAIEHLPNMQPATLEQVRGVWRSVVPPSLARKGSASRDEGQATLRTIDHRLQGCAERRPVQCGWPMFSLPIPIHPALPCGGGWWN